MTIYTTAPYMEQLGTKLDPMRRHACRILSQSNHTLLCCHAMLKIVLKGHVGNGPCARERLRRMRSSLRIKMVKRYRDKLGHLKIKGGPALKSSAAYPIGLGLKAGFDFILCREPSYDILYMSMAIECAHLSIQTLFEFRQKLFLEVGSIMKEYLRLGGNNPHVDKFNMLCARGCPLW